MSMVGFAMMLVLVFIGAISYMAGTYSDERNINRLTDLGYSLQSEIILAAEVEPGYERIITIPNNTGNTDYSIRIKNTDIIIRYRQTDLLFSIPNVTNEITTKGTHTISKPDTDTIILN